MNGYKIVDLDVGWGWGWGWLIGSSVSCGEIGIVFEMYLYVVFRNWVSCKFEYEDVGKEDESCFGWWSFVCLDMSGIV